MSFRIVANPALGPMPKLVLRDGSVSAAVSAAIVPTGATEALRARLTLPGALTVTTGQQPALFLGPLYTLHKALSAAALAQLLEERWGRPVIPIFWVAGDDHDWEEARGAHWLDDAGQLITGVLPEREPDAPMTPLWREPLGEGIRALVDRFARGHANAPTAQPVVEMLARCFVPGQTLAGASGQMLAELLAPLGVLILDSTAAPFKRAGAPLLLRAIRQHEELSRRLGTRTEELRAAGHDPGIEHDPTATLVMLDGPNGRDRIVTDGSGYRLRRAGTSMSLGDLERIAEREPQRLSANVLLRPVVESELLGTVGYCAGPGELRYLTLAREVFDVLGVPRPAAVPRWSGLLVDSYTDRMLARFGLSLEQLRDPARDVLAIAAADRLTPETVTALNELRRSVRAQFEVLGREAAAIAPPLERSAEGSERRIEFELSRLERRLVRSLKRRHETELRQLARARTFVLPAGRHQERMLCVAEPLARFGEPVMEAVRDAALAGYHSALEGPLVPT
ncbi:MAG TPA: bacillithiol biosynthesis cysteine-adding enzyme BshC [Gemmatimonadales bacterium]|nr:bacillithiol biosynthesis cysteine-adding enzyme BshC [Gemmatimonadales bacterium]